MVTPHSSRSGPLQPCHSRRAPARQRWRTVPPGALPSRGCSGTADALGTDRPVPCSYPRPTPHTDPFSVPTQVRSPNAPQPLAPLAFPQVSTKFAWDCHKNKRKWGTRRGGLRPLGWAEPEGGGGSSGEPVSWGQGRALWDELVHRMNVRGTPGLGSEGRPSARGHTQGDAGHVSWLMSIGQGSPHISPWSFDGSMILFFE